MPIVSRPQSAPNKKIQQVLLEGLRYVQDHFPKHQFVNLLTEVPLRINYFLNNDTLDVGNEKSKWVTKVSSPTAF